MSDTAVLVNTAVAIVAIVLLIVRFKLNPLIALVIGSCYLGLAAGLGVEGTLTTVATGFGDILAEIGLLIAFGVLMGALLNDLGAIRRLVEGLLRTVGAQRLPHAMALTIATFLQSIFLDVLLVISAPLARAVAPRLGRYGTARMATALAIGLECGIVFTVPGVAALALAGLLGVPLSTYLVYGLVVVIPTVAISITIMSTVFTRGWWKPELDELEPAAVATDALAESSSRSTAAGGDTGAGAGGTAATATGGAGEGALPEPAASEPARPPLLLLFGPLVAALLLVAAGAVTETLEWSNPVVAFLSTPMVALLIGLVGTCLVGRRFMGRPKVEESLETGVRQSGQILLLSGVGGSLAATIEAIGLGDILGGYLSAGSWAPLVVVWVIAAVLHIAVGSVTISAITAAGLLAPVASSLGLDPVLIALAAGAGSLFMVHLTSNTFWLLQTLMGQTTRGTLKSCSVGVSVASVVAMGPILLLSLFL
ncbi:GntP family permease [Marinitenerispora sediminis]|uniref:Gluconate permease n=1 Tax=Marinitenerispora sediminis TaxID=1931232 RepID=A0A368TBR1_9ACTN|nr:SLC13 family permease [Marinitenerispora sediminis]RCV56115.1 gluconate permease [Marinitenerispora sediminis]RCV57982.1 gluconate permease [Marinitenerispora sediminis]RCV62583.1 gluconate permease [Marinitenerispora sediminis]